MASAATMKLLIQALPLLLATFVALLVDFDAADLYTKLDKDANGTSAAHFHRQKEI